MGTINKCMGARKGALGTLLFILVCVLGVAACQAQNASSGSLAPHKGQVVNLTLIAYNYTDNYIDSYQVNGADGGNIFLSNSTTGGSKSGCCVHWAVDQPLPVTVHIRWQSSECIYTERVSGQNFDSAKSFYSERDVKLTKTPSANPKFFETHFYPDGHIEVAITDDYTPPRLKLQETAKHERPGARPEERCTPAQLREGENQ